MILPGESTLGNYRLCLGGSPLQKFGGSTGMETKKEKNRSWGVLLQRQLQYFLRRLGNGNGSSTIRPSTIHHFWVAHGRQSKCRGRNIKNP